VTIAGGEPTLHPRLRDILRHAATFDLVTSVVSNGARIDQKWIEVHGPFLRWLTLSIDSVSAQVAKQLGRHAGSSKYSHPDHVLEVAGLVHAWNAKRPKERRIRLKLNITVTSENANENPRTFIECMRPEKVKVLQMLMVKGENDDAADIQCPTEAFKAYFDRIGPIPGVEIVREDNDAMDGSYAMVDPLGRFYQRVDGQYKRSKPIHEVGVMPAWKMVGGFDEQRFVDRGGSYEPGEVARGNLPYLVAIEGLDGTGKSTVAQALAGLLGGRVVRNPPEEMANERAVADQDGAAGRRAWYEKANHRAAQIAEAALTGDGVPVVMDRSVASTLAFGAAESGSPVASWPAEIRRPDLLVLLTVPEPERQVRIRKRGQGRTAEESRLDRDHEFRSQVLGNYKALGATPIDATGPVEVVVARIADLLGVAKPRPRTGEDRENVGS
jgi:radical S-adenosyl methionine domain-containing protein 2